MSTVTVVLFPKARKDGMFPVRLRVTHQRKTAYKTLFYVKKGHFRSGRVVAAFVVHGAKAMNDTIDQAIAQTKEIIDVYQKNGWPYTAQEILEINYTDFVLRQAEQAQNKANEIGRDTIIFAGMHLAEQNRERENFENYRKYSSEMKNLAEFLATMGKTDLPIAELPSVIDKYIASLRRRTVKPVNSDSTFKRKIAQLMAIIRHAHRKGFIREIVTLEVKLDVVKAKKKKLTNDEIKRLETYEWPESFPAFPDRERETSQKSRRLAVETFLIQFYCFGARVGDIIALRNKDVQLRNGKPYRIEYYPQKARRKNEGKKLMQVDIPPAIMPIIEKHYRPTMPHAFLLPWIKPFWYEDGLTEPQKLDLLKRKVKSQVAYMDESLKDAIRQIGGFTETFSSHSARHTYAQRAKKKGKSIEFIKETLNHANYDTTASYLADLDADELNANMRDVYD